MLITVLVYDIEHANSDVIVEKMTQENLWGSRKNSTQETFTYPTGHPFIFPAGLAIGTFIFLLGIALFILNGLFWGINGAEWDIDWILMSIPGFAIALFSLRMIGRNVVIFDDNTRTITTEHTGFCFLQKQTSDMGSYGEFKECVLKWNQGSALIRFEFTNGTHQDVEVNVCGTGRLNAVNLFSTKQQKRTFVNGLNAWWKATPYYEENLAAMQSAENQITATAQPEEVEGNGPPSYNAIAPPMY